MNVFRHHPLPVLVNALRSVLGRCLCVALALEAGGFLAGLTVGLTHSHSFPESFSVACHIVVVLPFVVFGSLLTTGGLFKMLAMLIFAFLWIRSNWTLWLVLIFTALMWWNVHATLVSPPTLGGGHLSF